MSGDEDKAAGDYYLNMFRKQVEETKSENEQARFEKEKERLREEEEKLRLAKNLKDARVVLSKVFEEVRSAIGDTLIVSDIKDDSPRIFWKITDQGDALHWSQYTVCVFFELKAKTDIDTGDDQYQCFGWDHRNDSLLFRSSRHQLDDAIKFMVEEMGKIVGNYLNDRGGNK